MRNTVAEKMSKFNRTNTYNQGIRENLTVKSQRTITINYLQKAICCVSWAVTT